MKIIQCVLLLFFVSCGGGGSSGGGSSQPMLPVGNFLYYDGSSFGIFGEVFNGGKTYRITQVNTQWDVYQQETGTISYSGNKLTFHVQNSIPAGCLQGEGTWKFSNSDTTITLEATQPDQQFSLIVAEKRNHTLSEIISGMAPSCWN